MAERREHRFLVRRRHRQIDAIELLADGSVGHCADEQTLPPFRKPIARVNRESRRRNQRHPIVLRRFEPGTTGFALPSSRKWRILPTSLFGPCDGASPCCLPSSSTRLRRRCRRARRVCRRSGALAQARPLIRPPRPSITSDRSDGFRRSADAARCRAGLPARSRERTVSRRLSKNARPRDVTGL